MANAVEILIRARDEASAVFRRASDNLNRLTTDTKTAGGAAVGLARDYGIVPPQIALVADRVNAFVSAANASTEATSRLASEFPKLASQGIATSQGLAAIGAAAQGANLDFGIVNAGLLSFKTNLDAAQKGTGPAFDALTRLGFSASEIGRGFGSTSAALAAVGPKIAANTQLMGQAADATALFGKSGAQLIPVMGSMGGAAATASVGFGALVTALLPIALVIGTVVAAVAALGATLRTAVEGAKLADDLGDLAEKAGLTTEEISRLQFAAAQSDTSIQSISGSMKFLSKSLVEARQEGSEARRSFLALGLSAEEIDGGLTNAREALLRVADAIAATDDPLEKTAIATKLLGRSADELVPFLNRGRAGIEELLAEADRLGITVTEAAGRIGDDFVKSVATLQLQFQALKTELAVGVIPTLTELVAKTTEALVTIRELAAQPKNIFDGMRQSAEEAIPGLAGVLALINAVNLATKTAKDLASGKITVTPKTPEFFGPPREKLARVPGESDESYSQRLAALEALDKANAAAAERQKQRMEELAQKARDEAEAVRQFFDTLAIAPELFVRNAKPIPVGASKEDISPEEPEVELSTAPIEQFRAELELLGIDVDALNERLLRSGVALESLGGIGALVSVTLAASLSEAFDPYRNAVADARAASFEFVDSVGAGFTGMFQDIFVKGQNVFDSLGKFIRTVMFAVRDLLIQITAAIAKAVILKALGFGISGLFSGGGTVAASPLHVARGGPIAALAMGGPAIRRYAAGGAVGALLSLAPVVHAAGGLALPGGPSIADNVHAMLSPGEYVVPNFGARTGTSVVSQMVSESTVIRTSLTRLETVLARGGGGAAGGGRNVTFVVPAFDGESTRRGFSKGGSIERQLERLADEDRL